MAISASPKRSHLAAVLFFVTALFSYTFITVHGHGSDSGSGGCPFSSSSPSGDHHHHHHRHAVHDHHHHHHGGHSPSDAKQRRRLPEELAEEEDLKLERAHGTYDHGHRYPAALGFSSPLGLWLSAMGCSLLVSLASLICLVLLPVFFLKGKPSKGVVDCLATFGAGAMLGDAFLHQLPHAFGGEHSHSHDHSAHDHEHGVGHSHAHSIKDLSIGLSVLFGIVMFLVVEKLVRYVESVSGSANVGWGHHHHHHGHGKIGKLKADDDVGTNSHSVSADTNANTSDKKSSEDDDHDSLKDKSQVEGIARRSRRVQGVEEADANPKTSDISVSDKSPQPAVEPSASHPSSLVLGYLNLFSDGVHNFTDGMALGSAFLLYGSVGGWSRTLFLLAHELPQEIGDFGILVRSGFTVPKALFFNFLSALVALAGTALALLMGKEPGNSSLIEGFTAGGFIYIAVAGVLPELNSGTTAIRSTFAHLSSLLLGMGIALYISLVE